MAFSRGSASSAKTSSRAAKGVADRLDRLERASGADDLVKPAGLSLDRGTKLPGELARTGPGTTSTRAASA